MGELPPTADRIPEFSNFYQQRPPGHGFLPIFNHLTL
jgi:hypothetical protein